MEFMTEISLREKMIKLITLFFFMITLSACGGGGGYSGTISGTTGNSTSAVALYTTAPSAVTIGTHAAPTYAISGGTAPYIATSSNANFATASVTGTTLNITGIAAGLANVVVIDSVGATVTIAITVSPIATTPLTVLPGTSTANVGDVLNFSISGGSPNYAVTVNNPSIASVTPASGIANGGTFKATLLNVGNTTVAIVDSFGQTTTLTLTVSATAASLRLSPSALMVGENSTAPIALNIYGGTAPYTAYTSDLVLSSVSITGTTAAPTLTVGGGTGGNRCIAPVTAFGTYDVTVTVVDNLGASATSIITIKDNGGVACP